GDIGGNRLEPRAERARKGHQRKLKKAAGRRRPRGGQFVNPPASREKRNERGLDPPDDAGRAPPGELRIADELQCVAQSLLEVEEQRSIPGGGAAPERLRQRPALDLLSTPAPLVFGPAAGEVRLSQPGQRSVEVRLGIMRAQVQR